MDRIVVGMSGASGIAYGVRLLEALKEQPVETHFVATDSARLVHQHECDGDWADIEALAEVPMARPILIGLICAAVILLGNFNTQEFIYFEF